MATTRKTPQDHKPKATEAIEPASIAVTVRGRDWTIDGSVVDDIEFLEDIAALDRGNMVALPGFLHRLLGEEQYRAAKDVVRADTGRVRPQDLLDFLTELLGADGSVGVSLGESSAS